MIYHPAVGDMGSRHELHALMNHDVSIVLRSLRSLLRPKYDLSGGLTLNGKIQTAKKFPICFKLCLFNVYIFSR